LFALNAKPPQKVLNNNVSDLLQEAKGFVNFMAGPVQVRKLSKADGVALKLKPFGGTKQKLSVLSAAKQVLALRCLK
jgi:hypothetical protein